MRCTTRHRPSLAWLPFALALLSVWLAVPAANAAFPGANGDIAFSGDRFEEGDFNLYTTRFDDTTLGADKKTDMPDAVAPSWSPDGTKIAFAGNENGNYDIYTLIDGGGHTPQTTHAADDVEPTWSPTGAKIAFASNRDGNYEIYVMNADGTDQTRLTNNAATDTEPAWSPDGNTIAFTSFRDGNSELYVMNPDGTGVTRRTSNPAVDQDPNWSPDGTLIAFSSDRESTSTNIWVLDAEFGGQGRLSASTLESSGESEPAWSPDGKRIAIRLTNPDNKIAMLNSANGSLQGTFTVHSSGLDFSPDWQPLYPEHARPKAATPKRDPLVLAFKQCSASNTSREGPLSFGSCVPAVQASDHLTVGTYEANLRVPNSVGSVRMSVLVGDPTTPVNEADVRIKLSISDVRRQHGNPSLADYTGRLKFRTTLRITDRRNLPASGYVRSGTATDYPLSFNVPCAATASLGIGSTCSINTTVNTLYPGAVLEGKRAVWEIGDVEVWDGGTDGDPDTGSNTLFARSGLFIP